MSLTLLLRPVRDLLLSLHWFPWLTPGGCQGLSMSEISSENSESFDVWRTLAATGINSYRNRVTYVSQVMRPWGPLMPCTPQMLTSKYCQRWPIKTWKRSIFGMWMRGHCPLWPPLIPIYGEMSEKTGPLFNCQSFYACFGKISLELNIGQGVLPEPYMSQEGQGVTETHIVLKGLKIP